MIYRFLPFVFMTPFAIWIAYHIWQQRGAFVKAMGIVTMITAFVVGFLMLLNTVVLV